MRLEVRTLADRLVDVVRDIILSGVISPNVPIRQDVLAAELNVSKIPLREALARLEQDGLVVSHPNRGFFVRPMSAGEAEEVFALRLKIEPEAAARACLVANEAEREVARATLEQLDAATLAHKPTVGPLNRAFHLALVQPGGQQITANMVARLHIIADRYVRKHLEPRGRHVRARAEHEHIFDAWYARKAERVKKLVAQHLEQTLADLRRELNAPPAPPAKTAKAAPRKVRAGAAKRGRRGT